MTKNINSDFHIASPNTNDDIDYGFILRHERDPHGGFGGRAFVPRDKHGAPLGKSGVTFAGGLDIGQINATELKDLCFEDTALYEILRPYVGAVGTQAQALLQNAPLAITQESLRYLTRRKYHSILQKLMGYYGVEKFRALPIAVRTVLLSVAVQYGANLPHRTPRFWAAAIKCDWQALLSELRDFGDHYKTRRHGEAHYLAAALAVNKDSPPTL